MLENIKVTRDHPIIMKDIPDSDYFGKFFHKFVSNSRLSLLNPLQDGTPDKFFNGQEHSFNDSFFFGSAVHELILQPESFVMVDGIDRPTAKLGFMADELCGEKDPTMEAVRAASKKIGYFESTIDSKYNFIIKKCRPYWNKRIQWDRDNCKIGKVPIFIDSKRRKAVYDTVAAFERNNDFKKAMKPSFLIKEPDSYNEMAFVTTFRVDTGKNKYVIPFKGKTDQVIFDYDLSEVKINDVKTTGMEMGFFKDNILRFHYAREMAVYLYLAMTYAKETLGWKKVSGKSSLLAVESMGDHQTCLFDLSNAVIMHGWFEFVQLLKLIGYYLDQGCEL